MINYLVTNNQIFKFKIIIILLLALLKPYNSYAEELGKNVRFFPINNDKHNIIGNISNMVKPNKFNNPSPAKSLSLSGYNLSFYKKNSVNLSHDYYRSSNKIYYSFPISRTNKHRLSSPFGYREDPFTGERAFHAAIDIAAAKGTPVLAAASGKVNAIGNHHRLGKYVKITHKNGEYSLYGHLGKIAVKKGQAVSRGAKIGKIGMTGRTTGPHLDFSIRNPQGTPVDPLKKMPRHIATKYASR